ncbi:McrB family protein [Glycomyces paridis]|uniref:McrB family protein n=1 Tax=Glycomyces paridis TaxID=2126555 RepID=UPI0013051E42|nr:AAA family ATPase [Glycomyces paridis]
MVFGSILFMPVPESTTGGPQQDTVPDEGVEDGPSSPGDRFESVPDSADLEEVVEICAPNSEHVRVADEGNTIIISGVAAEGGPEEPVEELACVLVLLDAPDSLWDHIITTRAIDGQQEEELGAYTVRWSYHPDDGLNLTIVTNLRLIAKRRSRRISQIRARFGRACGRIMRPDLIAKGPLVIDPSTDQVLIPARNDTTIRAVGRSYIDVGFDRGESLFVPGRPVWNDKTVRELYYHYNLQTDDSNDRFHEKLERQLASASDDAKLLMAELMALQAMPLTRNSLKPSSKADRVEPVLRWMDENVALPEEIKEAFLEGTWNGGTGAHTMLWKWLFDAVELLRAWFRLLPPERSHIIADPWEWRDWIRGTGGMPSLTEALLYLGFPEHFLPIINVEHKRKIRGAFSHLLPEQIAGVDLDRDLFEITLRLQRQYGDRIDFYRPPFRDEWQTTVRPSGERRAWYVPPPHDDAELEYWIDQGIITISAGRLGPLTSATDRTTIRSMVESAYGHLDYADRAALTMEFHSFWSLMQRDDLVATVQDDQLWIGVLKHGAAYGPGGELSRNVDWYSKQPIALTGLSQSLRIELQRSVAVADISVKLTELSQILGVETDTSEEDQEESPPPLDPLNPALLQGLSERLHLDEAWLRELVSLVQDRKQVVLYGPPGTGKTYLAQELAEHLTDRDAVTLVQFHPSYAYEDFIEGFRPAPAGEGSVGFVLTAGPLRDLVRKARNDSRPHVLIIDEMNRAHLAKVFGELYFLLEYRNRSVRLQYSPEESFSLPENVYIIATMNTADRSIALLDAAIRRRFAFEEMHPEEAPVRDLLSNWLGQNASGDPRPALLRALNEAIPESDHDFKIGPSYLMRADAGSDEGIARIWRHDLLPLLEEHFHGRMSRSEVHETFGLGAIRLAAGTSLRAATEEQTST